MTMSAAEAAVNSMLAGSLARGEAVNLPGFRTFGTRNRPARTGRNPRTGESLEIAASTTPTFKPGKPLKDAANAGACSEVRPGNDRRQPGTAMPTMLNPAAFETKTVAPPRLSAHQAESIRDNGFLPTKSPSYH